MKKNIILIIQAFLFINIICDGDENNCSGSSSSVSHCSSLLTSEEKLEEKHCCLFTYSDEDNEYKQCLLLSNKEYKNLDDLKNYYEEKGVVNPDINCKSNYILLTLCNLILFFIL